MAEARAGEVGLRPAIDSARANRVVVAEEGGELLERDEIHAIVFPYYPSRTRSSAPLRLFVETVRELTGKPSAPKKRSTR